MPCVIGESEGDCVIKILWTVVGYQKLQIDVKNRNRISVIF